MKYKRELDDEAECVRQLVAILQGMADADRATYLLLTETDPRRAYRFGAPYGVREDTADEHERQAAVRRVVPGGGPRPATAAQPLQAAARPPLNDGEQP